jgi:hypothetical protein
VITDFHRVPRFSGTVAVLPVYSLMAWTGTAYQFLLLPNEYPKPNNA